MSLIKWSPFLLEPFEDMDLQTDEAGTALTNAAAPSGLIPLVDVYEVDNALMIEAPMPGLDPNNIELSIAHDILSIKAVHERKTEVEEKNYYRKEVRHGLVFRKIPLPAPVQEDAAEANYEDGVLKVRLPKRMNDVPALPNQLKKDS